MIDIANELKIIQGLKPGSTCNTASTGDWVNTENLHALYAIVDIARNVSVAATFNWYRGTNASGGGSAAVTTGCHFWKNLGCLFDRLTAATSSASSHTVSATTGRIQLVSRLDPAALPSSNPWVAFANANQAQALNFINMVYVGIPRYSNVDAFLATTSST